MSDQFSNMKFCVKLGKNASDTFALLSEAYKGKALKSQVVFEWRKWFKESSCISITNECNVHHTPQYQRYCSHWIHFTGPNSQL